MALQKPFSISIRGLCVDANENNTVSWSVSGDIQTSYKIDILLNSDNSLVFTSNQINSYSLKYTLPAATLTNGNEYKITVTIWNDAGNSITSDAEIFQTSSRPVVTVDPIGTVNSFSYNFTATYTQAENVALRNYIVNLYDYNKSLINNSDILTTLPMQYLFSNLQTEQSYYIEFQATSSKGLTGTSGLISFDVFYLRPKMNVDLQGINIDNAGIELSWFVRQIILQNNGGVFIDNEKIDLRNGVLSGNEGFTIDQDFSVKIWLESVPSRQDLITLLGDNGKLTLQYNAVLQQFVLTKYITNGITQSWVSNVGNGFQYVVLIQQIGNYINISSSVVLNKIDIGTTSNKLIWLDTSDTNDATPATNQSIQVSDTSPTDNSTLWLDVSDIGTVTISSNDVEVNDATPSDNTTLWLDINNL